MVEAIDEDVHFKNNVVYDDFSSVSGGLEESRSSVFGSDTTKNMALSARNQLKGKITKITMGDIMAHVVVKIGKDTIESVITRQSAEDLKLKKGDAVEVVIKSTEVMLKK